MEDCTDFYTKKTTEALSNHVRSRLRDGVNMKVVIEELFALVTDVVNDETKRDLMPEVAQ